MARKNLPPEHSLNARVENPFIHIPFQARDLNAVDGNARSPKPLLDVDDAYRQALSKGLASSMAALSREKALHPHALTHLVLKLREQGIAKTHRPIKLAEEASLQPAGHARINEMLVGASSQSLNDLNRVILQRGTQKILHNLSVIEEIQPWSRQRRNPEGSVRLLEHGRAVLRLFQYQHDAFNTFNYETVQRTLKSLALPFIEIAQGRGLPVFAIRDLDKIKDNHLELLLDFPGIRTVIAEPVFRPRQTVATPQSAESAAQASADLDGLPTVGVFDTGVSPSAKAIAHYVASRDTYVLPPDTNYEHGTAVGSLVAAGAHFNNKHAWLPSTPAMIHDVCALEVGGSNMSDLELRLSQAVRRRPDVKIWNISIGGDPCDESLFSDFAMTMDELSDK